MKKKRVDLLPKPRTSHDPKLYEYKPVLDPKYYEYDPIYYDTDALFELWAEEGMEPNDVLEQMRDEYAEYLKKYKKDRKAKKSAGKTRTAAGRRAASKKTSKVKPRRAAVKRSRVSAKTEIAASEARGPDRGPPSRGDAPGGESAAESSGGNEPPTGPVDPTADMTPKQKELYEAWVDFGRRLIPVLRDLEEDECLIINIKQTNRFVQFAGQGAQGMRVEATSNFYLDDREKLDEAQHAALLKLGWRAPTNLPHEFGYEPVGSPNYFLDIPPPLDFAAIASLAVNTLIGPLDADHPGHLEYKAFADPGGSIRFPTLGLKRVR